MSVMIARFSCEPPVRGQHAGGAGEGVACGAGVGDGLAGTIGDGVVGDGADGSGEPPG